MNALTVRLITAIIGLAVGFVIGLAGWFIAGWSLIGWLVIGATLGVAVGLGGLKFAQSDFLRSPTAEQKATHRMVILSISAAIIMGLLYLVLADEKSGILFLVVVLLTGVITWLLVRTLLQHRSNTALPAGHLNITIENNFMGDKLNRYLYSITKNEKRIDFADSPPAIQGFVELGLPLQLTILSAWGFTGFIGSGALADSITAGNTIAQGMSFAVMMILMAWLFTSVRDKPPFTEKGSFWVKLFGILAVGGIWRAFGFPGKDWFVSFVQDDTTHVWLVVLLPSLIWTFLRLLAYLDGFQLVTDEFIRIGTRNWILPDSPVTTMPKGKLTTAELRRGWFRTLLGYSLIKSDSAGDEDRAFHRIRVRHGLAMNQALLLTKK